MRFKLHYTYKNGDGSWRHGGFFPTLEEAKEGIEHFRDNLSKNLNFMIEKHEEVYYE